VRRRGCGLELLHWISILPQVWYYYWFYERDHP